MLIVLLLTMVAGILFLGFMWAEVTDQTRACYHDSPWTVQSRYHIEDEDVWNFELQCKTDGRIYTQYKAARPTWARIGDTLHFTAVFHNTTVTYEDQFKNR